VEQEPSIRPEPTDDERRAILAALAEEELLEPDAYRSRWREVALQEAVSADSPSEPGSALVD
jgi:hypothetical protein